VYQPPYMGSQLAKERRRELLAQAEQQHRARKRALRWPGHHDGPSGAERRMPPWPSVKPCGLRRGNWSNDGA